jgi:transketolase
LIGTKIFETAEEIKQTEEKANQIRYYTLECVGSIGMGHIGGSLSIADVLAVLYFKAMSVDPQNPKWDGRDRLVLSKGHAGPALYAALALKGFFETEQLRTLNKPGTLLPSHCDMNKTAGIDMTTGSLGQGMSAAVGMALAAKLDKNPCKIFAILGEGDNQEGQTWEAAMYAGHMKLNNIIAFTDRNGLQIDGKTDELNSLGDIKAKYESFGWHADIAEDGNDVAQIAAALENAAKNQAKPAMLILNTVKGKGVSFMENKAEYHHAVMTEAEIKSAKEEIKNKTEVRENA